MNRRPLLLLAALLVSGCADPTGPSAGRDETGANETAVQAEDDGTPPPPPAEGRGGGYAGSGS